MRRASCFFSSPLHRNYTQISPHDLFKLVIKRLFSSSFFSDKSRDFSELIQGSLNSRKKSSLFFMIHMKYCIMLTSRKKSVRRSSSSFPSSSTHTKFIFFYIHFPPADFTAQFYNSSITVTTNLNGEWMQKRISRVCQNHKITLKKRLPTGDLQDKSCAQIILNHWYEVVEESSLCGIPF